jgi:hypothetical protein
MHKKIEEHVHRLRGCAYYTPAVWKKNSDFKRIGQKVNGQGAFDPKETLIILFPVSETACQGRNARDGGYEHSPLF